MTLLTQQILLIPKTTVQNKIQILLFLCEEPWSIENNLAELLQVSNRSVKLTLNSMIREDSVKKKSIEITGGVQHLYSITKVGLKDLESKGMSAPLERRQSLKQLSTFREKISATFVPHQIDLQRLRIKAERSGCTDWVNADRGSQFLTNTQSSLYVSLAQPRLGSAHRPDAWFTDQMGLRVCVECERTLKSRARYQEILGDYLMALKRGEFEQVVWACPEKKMRDTLKTIITSIAYVQIGTLSVQVPKARYEQLAFTCYEDWYS